MQCWYGFVIFKFVKPLIQSVSFKTGSLNDLWYLGCEKIIMINYMINYNFFSCLYFFHQKWNKGQGSPWPATAGRGVSGLKKASNNSSQKILANDHL